MKVLNLSLWNFRAIGQLHVDFSARTTAFVGVNGVGKSTVLDALAIALSQLTWRVNDNPQKARPISIDDISEGAEFARVQITVELLGQRVSWATVINRKKLLVAKKRSGGSDAVTDEEQTDQQKREEDLRRSDLDELNTAVKAFDEEWNRVEYDEGRAFNLPLAVYYDVNRAVLEVPMRVREKLLHDPGEVYQDSLDHGGADFKRFFIWFRNFEDAENEQRVDEADFRDRGLEAARKAIQVFTGFTDLRVRRKPQMRMVVRKETRELNVIQLSDGERNMLAMVGDLARRLTVLNPGLANPNDGSGVVLIDELDLHLHPGWQRDVVRKLERTFPNCQFIVSTHSPQIVGELMPESVMLLKRGELLGHARRSLGMSSGEVLEELMEGKARNPEVRSDLDAIHDLVDSDKIKQARDELESLRGRVGDIPEVLELQAAIQSLEWLEDEEA